MAVALMTEIDAPSPPVAAAMPADPTDRAGSAGAELDVADEPAFVGSLSPSRAADFKNCPLLYRFRTIDRLPELPSRAATRGTMVHAVLEQLYDLPAAERTLAAAQGLVAPVWEHLLAADPELGAMFTADTAAPTPDVATPDVATPDVATPDVATPDGPSPDGPSPDGPRPPSLAEWLDSARDLVANYFTLEDPRRLEPAAREERVEVVIDGLRLRGYVDRLDISPTGDLRVVDYKTGSTPREAFEGKALFQMKFYALVLWRTRGVVPRQLRLIYLADVDTLTYSPEAEELERFERTLHAIWAAIQKATQARDFRPNPGRLCDWCDHHACCPAQGGVLPPFPDDALAAAGADRRAVPARLTTTDELPLVP